MENPDHTSPEQDQQVPFGVPPQPGQQIQSYGQPAYGRPVQQRIDPNLAFLELVGLIGFLGIGYLVAGRTTEGIIRLVGFMAFLFIGWLVAALLTVVLIGFCLMPILLALQVGIPIWSALALKKELEYQAY